MRGGVSRAHAALRHHPGDAQHAYAPAILRQGRHTRPWRARVLRRYCQRVGPIPSHGSGNCLMETALPSTRDRPAEGRAGGPKSQEPAPTAVVPGSSAGPPVHSDGALPIAFPRDRRSADWSSVKGHRRQLPLRWLSFVMIVAVPVALAAVYYFLVAADQ